MNKFKAGDKVKCIKPEEYLFLNRSRVYKVTATDDTYGKLKLKDFSLEFESNRFILVGRDPIHDFIALGGEVSASGKPNTQYNGIKVQNLAIEITKGSSKRGNTIGCRRSKASITIGPLSNQEVSC